MKFTSKPKTVEANQFTKRGECVLGVRTDEAGRHYVVTIHGQMTLIEPGDWIVQEPDGIHYYPVKPEIFQASYKPAEVA